MMNYQNLVNSIFSKKSFLCVGLDTVYEKIPEPIRHHYDNPVLEFNRQVIEQTRDFCVAYKINTAFYEAMGSKGWETLEKTVGLIPSTHFKIADAKRGDIGNTSRAYARAFFEYMPFDAITVSPYMGSDSIEPFLEFENKWVIILALTSNKGSIDFQQLKLQTGIKLYEQIIETTKHWGSENQIMYVVGATHPEELAHIRQMIPHHFILVPGVGAQGGGVEQVVRAAMTPDAGLLINVSRGILYAGNPSSFPENVKASAQNYFNQMQRFFS